MPREMWRSYNGYRHKSRPEGYSCPHPGCSRRYQQIRHYRNHIQDEHDGNFVPAAEYRPPTPPEDPPSPRRDPPEADAGPTPIFWDWGPSARHEESTRLLDTDTIEALGGGQTLVAHVRAMMKHIERVSKPILEKITPENAAVWPPLQQYQAEWAQLQAGLNSNSVSDRKICSNTPAEHFFWCETAACKNSVVRPCSKTV